MCCQLKLHKTTFHLIRTNKSSLAIGELRVDLLNVSSGVLSDNTARYHRPTGFTTLLKIIIFLWRTQVSYIRHILFNTTQSSNPLMDILVTFIYVYQETRL